MAENRHIGPSGRHWRPLTVALAGILLGFACGGGSTPTGAGEATGSPITIGVLDDIDPTLAIEGAEMRVNTDLAVAQINSSGGIHGHRVKVIYADPKGKTEEAGTLAQQLVQQQNVDILMGAVLSSECLAVQNLMPRLQIVYVSSTGCASEAFSAAQCNKYSFRITPAGRQGIIPLATYIVNTYGKKWAILYQDYAFGQSQANAYDVGLKAAGGELVQKIAYPFGETNITPYITKVSTDGSVSGLINASVGADLVRASSAIAQFGINTKMPVVGVFGKERFAGVYPDSLTRGLGQAAELSDAPTDSRFDIDYHKAFRGQLAKEDANIVSTLGGVDKAVPGFLGYEAYTSVNALKLAMISSNFTGKQDTAKLIAALETLKAKQGPEFPGGDFMMNKSDHQGVMTTYIAKINGQKEEVLNTVAPDKLPAIGSCQVK